MPQFFALMEWIGQNGWAAWFLLLIYMTVGVIREWLIKAGAAGTLNGVINLRKRRYEKMLTLQYLSAEARNLAKRELSQRSLYQLTGIYNYRLQNLAVLLCDRFDLRARYLAPWRSWLDERDGQLVFNAKWYRRAWRAFAWVCLPVTSMLMLGLSILFATRYDMEMLAPFMLLNIVIWWFPLLMITLVPTPSMTQKMQARLQQFNDEQNESMI
jgi:hypothetical protein